MSEKSWRTHWCDPTVRTYRAKNQRRTDEDLLAVINRGPVTPFRQRWKRVDSRVNHRLAVQEALKRGLIDKDPGPLRRPE